MQDINCNNESTLTISRIMLPEDANAAGIVHGGVVMKEIDNAAGVAAIRHTRKVCVTASIDRMDFHKPTFIGDLLIVMASVNMTGTKSMEIGARVESENLLTGQKTHIASAYLTFVALDENNRPTAVETFVPQTEDDIRRNKEAQARREMRLSEKRKENECQVDSANC